jgi:hypothetical protein
VDESVAEARKLAGWRLSGRALRKGRGGAGDPSELGEWRDFDRTILGEVVGVAGGGETAESGSEATREAWSARIWVKEGEREWAGRDSGRGLRSGWVGGRSAVTSSTGLREGERAGGGLGSEASARATFSYEEDETGGDGGFGLRRGRGGRESSGETEDVVEGWEAERDLDGLELLVRGATGGPGGLGELDLRTWKERSCWSC